MVYSNWNCGATEKFERLFIPGGQSFSAASRTEENPNENVTLER